MVTFRQDPLFFPAPASGEEENHAEANEQARLTQRHINIGASERQWRAQEQTEVHRQIGLPVVKAVGRKLGLKHRRRGPQRHGRGPNTGYRERQGD